MYKRQGRSDAIHPWIYDRCREVEKDPEGWLDLWSRFHYKSTIITLAGAVQEILRNPEITIGIFSHVLSISKQFVKQIQRALEDLSLIHISLSTAGWCRPRNACTAAGGRWRNRSASW